MKIQTIQHSNTMSLQWYVTTMRDLDSSQFKNNLLNPIEDVEQCNEILAWFRDNLPQGKFKWTKKEFLKKGIIENTIPKFEIKHNKNVIDIFAVHDDYGYTRVLITNRAIKHEKVISGLKALGLLLDNCPSILEDVGDNEEFNKIIKGKSSEFYNSYNLENQMAFEGVPENAVKYNGQVLQHVWSLDFHSAFPSALVRIRPETEPYIDKLYNGRKDNPEYKAILNSAIGAMASEYTTRIKGYNLPKYALAGLRDHILWDHNVRVHEVARALRMQGAIILNYRTDSIKFIWEEKLPPILPYQGITLGTWDYEFTDCQYRQFSTSKYQYIDNNGVHQVKLSGLTKLDSIKPREEWTWEDLENTGNVAQWKFNKNTLQIEIIGGI